MACTATTTALLPNVSCSQCGRDFGPGPQGFSYCSSHRGSRARFEVASDREAGVVTVRPAGSRRYYVIVKAGIPVALVATAPGASHRLANDEAAKQGAVAIPLGVSAAVPTGDQILAALDQSRGSIPSAETLRFDFPDSFAEAHPGVDTVTLARLWTAQTLAGDDAFDALHGRN